MANTHDDRPWWERWPEELTRVVSSLRGEGWTIRKLAKDRQRHRLIVELSDLPEPPGWLKVRFEPATPTAAPLVFGPFGLKEHQHLIDGNLCLPVRDADAVSAVRAAIELYQNQERHPAPAPEPRSQYLSSHFGSILLPLELPDGRWGTFTVRARSTPTIWGWVDCLTVGPDTGPTHVIPADPTVRESLRDVAPNLPSRRGVWVRTSEHEYPLDGAALLGRWRACAPQAAVAAARALIEDPDDGPYHVGLPVPAVVGFSGLVVPEEGPQRGVWQDRLIVIAHRPQGTPTLLVADPLTVSATRLPGLEPLIDKTVAVAGLGMIGGVVALHLAQSGVGAMRLLDPDRVEAGNLVRQPYEVQDVGVYKPRALRRRLGRAAPWCRVDPDYLKNDFIQRMPRTELLRWLEGCDLLVLTTSDKQGELYLSQAAKEVGVPVVGGWVGYGIWGGFVYVTCWGRSGCLNCIERHYAEVVKVPEPVGAREIFVAGCGHPTFPGSIVDGTTISDTIARLGMSVLSADYPPPDGDLATITIRDEHFAGSLNVTWREFPPDPDCSLCR